MKSDHSRQFRNICFHMRFQDQPKCGLATRTTQVSGEKWDNWEVKGKSGIIFRMIRLKTTFTDVTADTLYDVLHDPVYRKVEDTEIELDPLLTGLCAELGQAHDLLQGARLAQPKQWRVLLRPPLSPTSQEQGLCPSEILDTNTTGGQKLSVFIHLIRRQLTEKSFVSVLHHQPQCLSQRVSSTARVREGTVPPDRLPRDSPGKQELQPRLRGSLWPRWGGNGKVIGRWRSVLRRPAAVLGY